MSLSLILRLLMLIQNVEILKESTVRQLRANFLICIILLKGELLGCPVRWDRSLMSTLDICTVETVLCASVYIFFFFFQ